MEKVTWIREKRPKCRETVGRGEKMRKRQEGDQNVQSNENPSKTIASLRKASEVSGKCTYHPMQSLDEAHKQADVCRRDGAAP